jgi:hypothetical protein
MKCSYVDTIHVNKDTIKWQALVNKVMNILKPQDANIFLNSWATNSFLRRTTLHGVSLSYEWILYYIITLYQLQQLFNTDWYMKMTAFG